MIYIMFEREVPRFLTTPPECSPSAQMCSSISWEQNGYYAAQFSFVILLKLSRRLLFSVRFVFVSTFNLQRGRAFVVGINNLSKFGCMCKGKAPADHVYQRRIWEELKRGLRVAWASQPVERVENLEYRNQMFGVCWVAVYCSVESIFLNHPLYIYIYIYIYICVCVCVCVYTRIIVIVLWRWVVLNRKEGTWNLCTCKMEWHCPMKVIKLGFSSHVLLDKKVDRH